MALKREPTQKNMVGRGMLAWVVIIVCFLGSFLLKHEGFNKFNSQADTGQFYFTTENAVQFYFARSLATTGKIEGFQPRLQYPEGFNVNDNILLLMEKVTAFVYRLFSLNLPFHRYIFIFVSLYSSLTIIAIFLIVRSVNQNLTGALSAAVVFSFSLGAWARTIGSFAREDFTIPLLTFLLLNLILVLKGKKIIFTIGLLFISVYLSMISWHLSGFFIFLVLMIIFIILVYFNEIDKLKSIFLSAGSACLLAGLTAQPLRSKGFLFSPLALFIIIVIFSLIFKRWWWRSRIIGLGLVFGLWGLSVLAENFLLPAHLREYGHVYNLMLAKFRYLSIKPENPLQLNDAARSFWVGPYDSPSLPVIVDYLLLPLLLGIPSSIFLFVFKKDRVSLFLIILTIGWVIMALLMARFIVFGVLFLYLIFGIGVGEIFNTSRNRLVRPFFLLITAVVGIGGAMRLSQTPIRDEFMDEEIYQVLKYLADLPDPGAPVLTTFGWSGSIIAYTDKASILHPMFENESIRRKNLEIMKSFYATAEELRKKVDAYGIRYIWYLQNEMLFITGKSSHRYMAGITEITKRSPAYLMSFRPESLPYLEIVYQTSQHRIFKVVDPDHARVKRYTGYSFFFDEENFASPDTIVDEDLIRRKKHLIYESYKITRKALELKNHLQTAAVERLLKDGLRLFPRNIMALNNLGSLYHNQGRYEDALPYFQAAAAIDPNSPEVLFNLGLVYIALNQIDKGIEYLAKVCQLAPEIEEARIYLAECLIKAGRNQEAIRTLKELLEINPDNSKAQEILKKINKK